MAEVERYTALQADKEMMAERFEEQHALLQEGHERALQVRGRPCSRLEQRPRPPAFRSSPRAALAPRAARAHESPLGLAPPLRLPRALLRAGCCAQELTEEYDAKLQEDALALERVKEERAEREATFEETRAQIEEDVDREVTELRTKYEARLQHERNEALKLKGENGIMRKNYAALEGAINEQKEEIASLFADKKELYEQIASLEKDIAGLKREIKERDETIGDKEKRIYDLKKKNQELDKFKFVLDYKIKELKKQIEPRELEISELKQQANEINGELERYHKLNLSLELVISDLKGKLDGLQREVVSQRTKLSEADAKLRVFKSDLHEAIQHVQDPKELKEAVKALYLRHANDHTPVARIEAELQAEYQRQRQHLERSVESLKRCARPLPRPRPALPAPAASPAAPSACGVERSRVRILPGRPRLCARLRTPCRRPCARSKLNKNMEMHRGDNGRMMQENIALIKASATHR